MKKILLSLSVILISISSYAQFDRGTMMVGGAFGLEFNKNKDKFDGNSRENYRSTSFALEPQFGYFVANRFAIGAGLGINVSSYKSNENDFGLGVYKSNYSSLSIEPFARYYLPQGIFFQGKFMVGIATQRTDYDGSENDANYTLTGLALSAGYAIMLNDNIAVEPQVGFSSQGLADNDSDGKVVDNTIFLRVGFQIYLNR